MKLLVSAATVSLLLSLTSCVAPSHTWVYLGAGGDLRLALCRDHDVSAVHIELEDSDGQLMSESTVWSGPLLRGVDGSVFASDSLPAGWQQTKPLALEMDWMYLTYTLYSHGQRVGGDELRRADMSTGEWKLSPPPSWFGSSELCATPSVTEMIEIPESIEMSEWFEATSALAMPEPEFWAIIDEINGTPQNPNFEKLVDLLSKLPYRSLTGFETQLQLQLYHLDTAALWDQAEEARQAAGHHSISTDVYFARLRIAILAGGEEAALSAISGGPVPSIEPLTLGRTLAEAANAAKTRAGTDQSLLSLHPPLTMGANPDGW